MTVRPANEWPRFGAFSYDFQRGQIDPVCLLRDADHAGLHVSEGGDGAGIRRQLDEDDIARIDEDSSDEVEPLL